MFLAAHGVCPLVNDLKLHRKIQFHPKFSVPLKDLYLSEWKWHLKSVTLEDFNFHRFLLPTGSQRFRFQVPTVTALRHGGTDWTQSMLQSAQAGAALKNAATDPKTGGFHGATDVFLCSFFQFWMPLDLRNRVYNFFVLSKPSTFCQHCPKAAIMGTAKNH